MIEHKQVFVRYGCTFNKVGEVRMIPAIESLGVYNEGTLWHEAFDLTMDYMKEHSDLMRSEFETEYDYNDYLMNITLDAIEYSTEEYNAELHDKLLTTD